MGIRELDRRVVDDLLHPTREPSSRGGRQFADRAQAVELDSDDRTALKRELLDHLLASRGAECEYLLFELVVEIARDGLLVRASGLPLPDGFVGRRRLNLLRSGPRHDRKRQRDGETRAEETICRAHHDPPPRGTAMTRISGPERPSKPHRLGDLARPTLLERSARLFP